MKDKKKTALTICIILLVVLILLIAGGIIAAVVIRKSVISRDEACSYAFADAGVDSSSVNYVFVEFDYDYGHFIYEVEFIADRTEYEYIIKASDGSIIKKETDGDYSGIYGDTLSTTTEVLTTESTTAEETTESNTSSYISENAAKAIALNAAGLAESDVSFKKIKLEKDDGIVVYEVEFNKGFTEYEYTINATTGDIIEYDIDAD